MVFHDALAPELHVKLFKKLGFDEMSRIAYDPAA
jgi:hypothetical protein